MSSCDCRDDYLQTPAPCPDIPLPPPRPLPPMADCRPCPPPRDCSNHTPNYGLPLWKASDVTSWLMQMNGAMLRIDTIMHDLALRTGINGLPDDLVSSVSKLIQDVGQLNCQVGELSNKAANNELLMQNINTSFSAMKTDLASLQLSLTNFDTRLMTVDSANQGNKNDITLLKTDLNMLSSTVNALQKNFQQYQQATNQTLATIQSTVTELSDNLEEVAQNSTKIPEYEKFTITQDDLEFSKGTAPGNYEKLEIGTWSEDGTAVISRNGMISVQPPRFTVKVKDGETVSDFGWIWIKSKQLTDYKREHSIGLPTYGGTIAIIAPSANTNPENRTSVRMDFCSITDSDGEPLMGFHLNLTGCSETTSLLGASVATVCYKEG